MPKNNKLKKGHQINGKIENLKEEKFVPNNLEQLWHGTEGLNKYNTLDVEEYKKQLSEMNTADLRSHALKHQIMPSTNRERLSKRLVIEFNKHVNGYRRPEDNKVAEKKPSKAVLDILAEAK